MMHDASERVSFPVSPENTPTKRRAVFYGVFRWADLASCAARDCCIHLPKKAESGR